MSFSIKVTHIDPSSLLKTICYTRTNYFPRIYTVFKYIQHSKPDNRETTHPNKSSRNFHKKRFPKLYISSIFGFTPDAIQISEIDFHFTLPFYPCIHIL